MFVELLTDHITVNERIYPKQSVVETDKRLGDSLINQKHAVAHLGPAFEPEPEEPPRALGTLRNRVTEKATKLR